MQLILPFQPEFPKHLPYLLSQLIRINHNRQTPRRHSPHLPNLRTHTLQNQLPKRPHPNILSRVVCSRDVETTKECEDGVETGVDDVCGGVEEGDVSLEFGEEVSSEFREFGEEDFGGDGSVWGAGIDILAGVFLTEGAGQQRIKQHDTAVADGKSTSSTNVVLHVRQRGRKKRGRGSERRGARHIRTESFDCD